MKWLDKVKKTKVLQKLFWFFGTPWYMLAVAVVVLIGHVFALDLLSFYILAAVCCFVTVFGDDTTAFLPPFLSIVFCVSKKNSPMSGSGNQYTFDGFLGHFVVIGIFVVASIIFRLIVYKEYKNLFVKRRLNYGLAALLMGLLMNGLFFPEYTISNLFTGFYIGACFVVVYLFFAATLKWDKSKLRYLAKTCMFAGLTIVVQMAVLYLTDAQLHADFDKINVTLGWAISNHIGAILFVTMPLTFYLAYKSERFNYLYFLAACAIMLGLVLTLSRTCLLFGLPIFVLLTIFTCIFGKKRLAISILTGILLLGAVAVFILFREKILGLLAYYIENGFDDNGRFGIWKEGLELFLTAPVFGTGIMHKYKTLFFSYYFYHNTIVQYLVTGGIVGLGTYLFHRVQTIGLFVKKLTVDRVFLAVGVFGLLLICLLDNPIMYPYFLFYYMIFLLFAEKDLDYTLAGNYEDLVLAQKKIPTNKNK